MVNRERLATLIGEIEKAVGVLTDLSKIDKKDLLSDLKLIGSVKYYLILATEACVDICNHIAVYEHAGVPGSYADCFLILAEKEILTPEFANRMANMARFRNLLVHLYWKVDDERVYEILKNETGDFEEFVKLISRRYL